MFIKLLKKGVELSEKLRFLSEGCEERIFIPQDKHIIKDSSPPQVGVLWIEELFQKVSTLDEVSQDTPLFDFNWETSSMFFDDYNDRFCFEVDRTSWNLCLNDIVSKKPRCSPLDIFGFENKYIFRSTGGSIKTLDSYMEKLWRYFTWESKSKTFDSNRHNELDWFFHLRILHLLIESFPNTDIGIQKVFEKYSKREEKHYGTMSINYSYPWSK